MWLTLARKSHRTPAVQEVNMLCPKFVQICSACVVREQGHGDGKLCKRFTEFHMKNAPMLENVHLCFPAHVVEPGML